MKEAISLAVELRTAKTPDRPPQRNRFAKTRLPSCSSPLALGDPTEELIEFWIRSRRLNRARRLNQVTLDRVQGAAHDVHGLEAIQRPFRIMVCNTPSGLAEASGRICRSEGTGAERCSEIARN
jgi:hypothetical protein